MASPGNTASTSVKAELRVYEHAPMDARRALAAFGERLTLEVTQALALVASELVTNSVRHSNAGADARIHLEASVHDDFVRVSVLDSGRSFRPNGRPPGKPGGWGLQVVDQLADRWWIEVDGGTRVTCELSRRLYN